MVKLHLELEGEVPEVIWALRRIGGGDNESGEVRDGLRPAPVEERTSAVQIIPEPGTTAISAALVPARWTEELAGDFTAGLEPAARRMALHVWRAGAAGIHRSTLCQRTELTPRELHSLLIQMGHALRRFQREPGLTLSRPVVGNSPLQRYFVDLDFAAAASDVFGERTADRLA